MQHTKECSEPACVPSCSLTQTQNICNQRICPPNTFLLKNLNWLEDITTQDEVVPQLCLLLRHSNERAKNLTGVSQDLLECEGLFCNLKKKDNY